MEMQTQIYCIIANCYQHESVHVTSLRPAPVVIGGFPSKPFFDGLVERKNLLPEPPYNW